MFSEYLEKHPLLSVTRPACPYPSFEDRAGWDAVRPELREAVMALADKYRNQPYPMRLATGFLAFVRDGSRKADETNYFLRRRKLVAAVMGCCMTGTLDDLDDVIDGIWCICEETSWVISAHNGSSHEGMRPAAERPLPEKNNPYVDLFSAQTAMVLSYTCQLLKNQLDQVSPLIVRRVRQEIEQRVLIPFMARDDFWWMGFIRKDLCNWTPWIVSNVLFTACAWIDDPIRLAELISRGCRMLDRWIDVLPADGGCDEGAGYWNMAGGALMDCLELLKRTTGMDFSDDEKLRGILTYPVKAALGDGWYVNFADCDARPFINGERLQAAGLYLNELSLVAFGATICGSAEDAIGDVPHFSRLLSLLFDRYPETVPAEKDQAKDVWLPDLQLRVLEKGRCILAAKGGHNGESHNHNDVGAFMLYVDGQPVIVDAGNMVYTAKTFSDERYSLWNIRSMYHNVPMLNGQEQKPGTEYSAEAVTRQEDGLRVCFSGAYGQEADVENCERTICLNEKNQMILSDRISFSAPASVTEVLMLRHQPVQEGDSWISGPVALQLPENCSVKVEEIFVKDERMAKSFPGSLWRMQMVFAEAKTHEITIHALVRS